MTRQALVGFSFSLETGSVAVRNRQGQIFERVLEGHRSHANDALQAVADLMQAAGITAADVAAVAADTGPGGFTGLRTACGMAQGLAVGWNVPCITHTSLHLIARAVAAKNALTAPSVCITALDARQQEVYAAAWRIDGNGLQLLAGPVLLAYGADAMSALTWSSAAGEGVQGSAWEDATADAQAWIIAGPGAAHLSGHALQTDLHVLPSAATLVELAAADLAAGRTVSAVDCQPVYVRNQVALTTEQRREQAALKAAAAGG